MQTSSLPASNRFYRALRTLFAVLITPYIIALTLYLLLRLIFGDRFWWLSLLNTFAHLLFLPLVVLLPLAVLLRARGSTLRMLPLVLVGGLWIAPYYLPKAAPEPAGQTLRLLSFNVWGNNKRLDQLDNWLQSSDMDVLLLQEITPEYAEQYLPGLFQQYPYHNKQADTEHWNGILNYNTTLSRYPIVDVQSVSLNVPDTSDPERIVLDVNGRYVAVYNVHLAWPVRDSARLRLPRILDGFYTRVVFGFDDRMRNQQITRLIAHLQENEPLPYIVAGDFNTSDQSATYQQLATAMKDSFREGGQGWRGSWPVSGARGLPSLLPPLIRIDYIWHSSQFETVTAGLGPPLGSDHLPVLATLMLKD